MKKYLCKLFLVLYIINNIFIENEILCICILNNKKILFDWCLYIFYEY